MKTLLLYSLLLSTAAHAYTLNNNFGASFKDNKVKVSIAGNSTCANIGVTANELESYIDPANDDFWNRVPTSNLVLKSGGFTSNITNIDTGRLCAPTDDACITAAAGTVIPPVTDIVISCNSNAANFGDPNVLAVTIPNNFSGRSITGAVILVNNSAGSTAFANLSKDDRIGVIAHEIGHAIGLGHSDVKASLMYYRTVDQRSSLGEDDMKGVSYLYPMQVDGFGLLGGCATITTDQDGPGGNFPYWPMLMSLGLMVAVAELIRLAKRSKARATF